MRDYTCILCPNGCVVSPSAGADGGIACAGARCPKGAEYVRQELTDPRRSISSLAKVTGGDRPLVGVRLTRPVPKARIAAAAAFVRGLCLSAPVEAGQIVAANPCGLDSDLVAIDSIHPVDTGETA